MVGALVSLLGVREEVASDVEHFGTADGRIFSLLLKIRTFNYQNRDFGSVSMESCFWVKCHVKLPSKSNNFTILFIICLRIMYWINISFMKLKTQFRSDQFYLNTRRSQKRVGYVFSTFFVATA